MDNVQLKNQLQKVVKCDTCERQMVNIDADQLALGDLKILRDLKVSVSNPDTEKQVCVHCETPRTFGQRVRDFLESTSDDDDSPFFGGGGFGSGWSGGSSGGGFGGFGGFGGGGFSGGGASGGF